MNKYDEIYSKTGEAFNIFDIISSKEIQLCRFIYELLNPNGCHFQKAMYLKLFCKDILHKNSYNENELKNAIVNRELQINESRRIDLALEICNDFYPIEVKIDAKDQKLQCYDYYNYKKCDKVFYLTINGDYPSDESKGNLSDSQIECLKWAQIRDWIKGCIKATPETNTILITLIKQFESEINLIIGDEVDKMRSEINELIAADLDAATKIYTGYRETIEKQYKDLLKEIAKGILKENNHENQEVEADLRKNKYWGVTICINEQKIRIEIEWCPYVGSLNGDDLKDDWEYLKTEGKKVPDFHNMNQDALVILGEKDKKEKFIKDAVKLILKKYKS